MSPEETWQKLFEHPPPDTLITETAKDSDLDSSSPSFTPSLRPSHQQILRLLRENEAGTITIVAVGPMSNLAMAAAEDPETFLKVKEVVVMGGAVDVEGNVRLILNHHLELNRRWLMRLAGEITFLHIDISSGHTSCRV